jgi:hypothetical protein
VKGRNTSGTSSRFRSDASEDARSRSSEVGATLQRTSQESKLCRSFPELRLEAEDDTSALVAWPMAVGNTAVAAAAEDAALVFSPFFEEKVVCV